MYPSPQSARHPAQALSMSSQYIPSPYDFTGYHHHPGVADPSATWTSLYAPREEYPYTYPGSSPGAGQVGGFTSVELSSTPTAAGGVGGGGGGGGGGGSFTPYNFISGQDPFTCRRRPQEPVRPPVPGGKTRTKDKYRVVYTDHQRLELEKEFQCNRYITMKRKTELSMVLTLSERQVKIWFQNRRAKERKMNRKKLQHSQQASSTTTPTPPALPSHADLHLTTSPSSNILSDAISEEY